MSSDWALGHSEPKALGMTMNRQNVANGTLAYSPGVSRNQS